jgi:glycosyltransferase involved in cell wall biosynthesis
MTGTPTVTVVLIFYDDVDFLAEAIESVEQQTFPDWELILVDDGSTDGSSDLARAAVAASPGRLRYVDHPGHVNRGISATRNLGWRLGRGRYVAFLDSDDVWETNKLTDQIEILQANPDVGLVVGASLYWWRWAGDSAPRDDQVMLIGAPADRIHLPHALLGYLYPLSSGVAPCPSSFMVRRDVLEAIGGFEESFPGMYEDQAFLMKVYHHAPVWVSSHCWDRYRRHPGQMMSVTGREGYHEARKRFLSWYEGYLHQEGIDDPDVRRALRRAWWPYEHPRLAAIRRFLGTLRARIRRRVRSAARDVG